MKNNEDQGFLTEKELSTYLGIQNWGVVRDMVVRGILNITKIATINKIYKETRHLPAIEFIDAGLEALRVTYTINEEELSKIPETGPFISISNHPLGAIDGMILMRSLLERRADYKVMANFLLKRMEPVESYIIPVNSLQKHQDDRSSLIGLKNAYKHVLQGNPLGIFPAGLVATEVENGVPIDKEWNEGMIKFIMRCKAPVLPVYFQATNSNLFYKLGEVNDSLRKAMFPREMTSQYKRPITMRIGAPISYDTLKEMEDISAVSKKLRSEVYDLV